MEHIFLPTAIEFIPGDMPHTGKVIITPCSQGYGTTLGNALRRVLLSSLPGAAVESIQIKGVQHEFSAFSGVKEDVIEIILNLKQLAVRCHSGTPVTLSLSKKGVGEIRASDIAPNAEVEIMNPELVLATITDPSLQFEMDITIGRGRGYIPVEEKPMRSLPLGTIAIDSLYTPIRDVGYQVEMTRVGDVTDFEKLTMTIETNGTMTPREAVAQATKILMDHFSLILSSSEESTYTAEEETAPDVSVDMEPAKKLAEETLPAAEGEHPDEPEPVADEAPKAKKTRKKKSE